MEGCKKQLHCNDARQPAGVRRPRQNEGNFEINELWLDVVSEKEDDPISKEFAAELQGRVASYAANPENVYTVDQVMEEIRKDLQA